jgi:hypothetical protein
MKRIVTLINTLREKGYKITPQRRVIIEQLVTDKSHPTVEEIYQRVRSVMPEVSRTTIYNTDASHRGQGAFLQGSHHPGRDQLPRRTTQGVG